MPRCPIRTSILLVALALPGCGGAAPGAAPSGTGAGHEDNPDGVPYPTPTGGYGRTARSGSTPGSVIANFKFQGFADGDPSRGPTTVSLSDYYDPCARRHKLIHLTVAAVWCQPCFQETDALVAARSRLAAEGVVVLQALDDGPTAGTPATLADLGYWVKAHRPTFAEVLDPGLANLAGFFDASAVPWNADLDPRTMEILDESVGWSGDVDSEIRLAVVPEQASYAVPVACP